MESLFETLYYKNSLKDWAISIGIIILSFLVGRAFYWVSKNIILNITEKTRTKLDDIFINQLGAPLISSIVTYGVYFGILRLTLPESVNNATTTVAHFIFTLLVTWFIVRFTSKLIDTYLIPLTQKSETTLDDQLLPTLKKAISLGLWALGIVVGLNNAGFNVGALVAGMGIGGLAFAMAAKDTISNFFGGLTVFTDRPFKIGDRIKTAGIDGFVTEIGIRSTRLKTLEGRIVTIPNSKFIDGIIENVTLEPSRKVVITLGLVYETSHQQVQKALSILEEIINSHSSTHNEKINFFENYGDFSLNIRLIYYITSGEDIFKTQSEINVEILKRFNEEGLGFAFPTTTLDIPKEFQK